MSKQYFVERNIKNSSHQTEDNAEDRTSPLNNGDVRPARGPPFRCHELQFTAAQYYGVKCNLACFLYCLLLPMDTLLRQLSMDCKVKGFVFISR
ncbi:hypothetical protein EYF80_000412 [Liparis tanakae]|uniref:Uncharacterized protein n=1 Tax=Liparis tanakae TaxID=230148 RepID=A0A4Z2JHA7_9TELE|nr:hypothetical protein EYF80_000412 [Liparis tanakae]